MHPVIMDRLEEYMADALAPVHRRQFEVHLESCEECRLQVIEMREVSGLFSTLRSSEAPQPTPGFASRVLQQVGAHRVAPPSFWSLFGLDFAFGRRVAFASLLTLATLGSYLLMQESNYSSGPANPESVMVMTDQDPAEQVPLDRDHMLVTLTSYEP